MRKSVGLSGRDREVARIRQANRACAAGRLLLGEMRSWEEFLHPLVAAFLDEMKPLRDALAHPSPFSSPARFGGRNKLRAFYRADAEPAEPIAAVAIEIITKVWEGVSGGRARPGWLQELRNLIGERLGDASGDWGLVAVASPGDREPGARMSLPSVGHGHSSTGAT